MTIKKIFIENYIMLKVPKINSHDNKFLVIGSKPIFNLHDCIKKEGIEGIWLCKINWCTPPITINIIIPSVYQIWIVCTLK